MSKKVTVHIRAKPVEQNSMWWIENGNITYEKKKKKTSFNCFKSIYHREETAQIYSEQILPAMQKFKEGVSVTVLAYGQTGAGKTFTMLGENEDGLIYLAMKDIFPTSIQMSYIEIYNERVYDLKTLKELHVYSKGKETFISNLHVESVRSEGDARSFMELCNLNKRSSPTEYNLKSSRSHTIIQMRGEKAAINFVDLAGCEKACEQEERRKEGSFINRSLLALGKLVTSLSLNNSVGTRESKLTRILSQSFKGNVEFIAFCMICTAPTYLEESLSTLQFAARLSNIDLKGTEAIMLRPTINKIAERGGLHSLPTRFDEPNRETNRHNGAVIGQLLTEADNKDSLSRSSGELPMQDIAEGIQSPTDCHKKANILEQVREYQRNMLRLKEVKNSLAAGTVVKHIKIREEHHQPEQRSEDENDFIRELLEADGKHTPIHPDDIQYSADIQPMSEELLDDLLLEIYEKRIKALENMVLDMLEKSPNRLFSEIFFLEKQMFNLRKGMLKYKQDGEAVYRL